MIEGISSKLLPAGGIAVSARSGTGKSSWFFGSDYVQAVLLADTGSQGYKIYHKGPRNANGEPVDIVMIDPRSNASPMDFARDTVIRWTERGKLWCVDSFSTLIQHQCVWMKGARNQLSQPDYQSIVGKARDLALLLAQLPGFTVFNTSPGGKQKLQDGSIMEMPQGSIIALPALSGLSPGAETILSRWTTSLVMFQGFAGNASMPAIPRGFILADKDFRSEAARQYCPIKDPMVSLIESTAPKEGGQDGEEYALKIDCISPPCGHPGFERPGVDVYLERLAAKFPERLLKPGEAAPPPPSSGPTNGKELYDYVAKVDADLAKDKRHKPGELQAHVQAEGEKLFGTDSTAWDQVANIAAILAIVKKYQVANPKKPK